MSMSLFLFYKLVHLCHTLIFYIPHISDFIWYLSFSFWLTSLSMIISRLLQMALFHSILWLSSIPLHTRTHTYTYVHTYIYTYMYVCVCIYIYMGFPCSSVGKESACNAGDLGSRPWVRKIPWRKKWSHPFQPGILENPMTEESGRLLSTGWQESDRT